MFHLFFKLMLLLGASCAMEQRVKQRTPELNSRLFDLASKESARNEFVGQVVNQISFEFVEENWRNIDDLELDLGLIRLCELQRVEHHFAPGVRVKLSSGGENDGKSLKDIMKNDLILTGVQCDIDQKHRSFITFERDHEGLTEMSGDLMIGDVTYEIEGRTGELFLKEELPFERDDVDRRNLATLAPGQLDLKIHVTLAENLVDYYGTPNKAIMKVMEAFDWGWDAMYDLGYDVVVLSMEFVETVPAIGVLTDSGLNYNKGVINYMKTSHPPNPSNTHLTFHVGCYVDGIYAGKNITGMVDQIGAIYGDVDHRYAFHSFCPHYTNQHYCKSGITHELGHMVGLYHMHAADVYRLGEPGQYCWDPVTETACCDALTCNCPESKRTIMSYCQAPEYGHHFSPGQHHKAEWQLTNPTVPDYATPGNWIPYDLQYLAVDGMYKVLEDEGETIRDYYGTLTVNSCRLKCESNPSCHSYTYCNGQNNCHLKSLVVLGTEPTKSGGTCTSFYRKSMKNSVLALNENGNFQHSYKDLGNGENGYCVDSNFGSSYLGDWDVDSYEKCRALCDSFFACAGFQYGRNGKPFDCNLYHKAEQNKPKANRWTPCYKKLDKIYHDGYSWKGRGYCRNANGQNENFRQVTVVDEIACVKECNQDPECEGFALGVPWDALLCILYKSAVISTGSSGVGGCWAKI